MEAAALQIIENYCNRKFAKATYVEEYKGSGLQYLNLKQYPIISLTKVEINGASAGTPSWSEVSGIYVLNESGQLFYEGGFFQAERMYKATYEAGYATLPADITACINMISGYLTKQMDSAGIKKETVGEVSYEKFESSGDIIKDLNLGMILNAYRAPTCY